MISSEIEMAVLALIVFFAGFVDALAGGGGLLTLPAYLSAGLDPALLLGTNKLSSSIGTVASALRYQKKLRLSIGKFWPAISASLLGSFLGARLAVYLDPSWIKPLLIATLPAVAYFLYTRRRFGLIDRSAELLPSSLSRRAAAIALGLGAYDGFFGPGTGTFLALGLARFCRHDLLAATGKAKILNLASNASALIAFLIAGRVCVPLGLIMGGMSLLGHWTGAHWGIKKGAPLIRPAVLLVCAGLLAKLLVDGARAN